MAEDGTYLRAKLTEINVAIDRLTDMMNRMVEVMTRLSESTQSLDSLSRSVAGNNERLDELMKTLKGLSAGGGLTAEGRGAADRGQLSSLAAVLDTLDSQIRDGVIASDLAKKIDDSATMMEQKGGAAALVVKMQRWVRILRTYGRVDPISSADLSKLRADLKEWQKEISQMRT
ncbi:MAG: hypothetical protein HXY34_05595 [Candidatus Thorarchaeota archaeon]|nr:hypothetical protein [Candidatus Thorarchaeota archaeon]